MAWKVEIKQSNMMAYDVLIYRETVGGGIEMMTFGDNAVITVRPVNADGSYQYPTLRIPMRDDILPQLAKAINEAGIKLPDESFTNGVLKAQTAHLEDLRQLLKLNDSIVNIHMKAREDATI